MRGKTLYVNGRIYSMEREGEIFGSMLTDGGRISALYEEPFPEQPRGRVRRVDLGGKTVLPGLTDCHSHFITTGALRKMSISISGISGGTIVPDSLEGVAAKIKEAGERTSKRKPLLCINYIIPSVAENRLPTSAELDAWLPGRSVIVLSMDGHSSSYSGRALKESGIGKDAPPEGILTGEAHEFNMGKVNSYMMKSISPALLLSGIAENVNDAAAHGLTGIHCLEGFEDDPSDPAPRLLAALAGGIPQKLRLYPQYMDLGRIGALEKKMLNLRVGGCGSWEMDGSVSSHSAAFFSDYADKPGCRGSIYYKADDLYRTVSAADARGYQVAAHAIGPGGIEIILGVFENLAREKGASGNERRHRIEHFEFPTADQVRRAAALGLIITVQPGFSWADEKFQKSYRKYLTPEQFESQVPLRELRPARRGNLRRLRLAGAASEPLPSDSRDGQLPPRGSAAFGIRGAPDLHLQRRLGLLRGER